MKSLPDKNELRAAAAQGEAPAKRAALLDGLGRLLDGCIDLLFPARCAHCRTPLDQAAEMMLCSACRAGLLPLLSPLCRWCGAPLSAAGGEEDRLCAACLRQPPPFDGARSLFLYQPPLSELLQRLKFQGDTVAAAAIGQLGRRRLAGIPDRNWDFIVPVPLHRKRLRQRGLNQAQVLARHLFPQQLDRLCPRALHRRHNTAAQTGLSGRQRRRNLHGAFAAGNKYDIRAKRVLLLDDVYTTGTTVMECARTLKRAGAAEVQVLTVARVESGAISR